MPRTVDRDRRRDELVAATGRLILDEGLAAVTLRRVAEVTGFANGAVKPYFPTKDELLHATCRQAFERAEARVATAVDGTTGLEALRRQWVELLPLDDERRLEARVVTAFWEAATQDRAVAALFAGHHERCRTRMYQHLREGRARGEVRTAESDETVVDEALWLLVGLRASVALGGDAITPRRQRMLVEKLLEHLTVPPR
ncbi:TetR/AcrR family transcriptional regulator [Cellulomonas marina]|uniref:DNA-binding transcriptional regulator, AcrR family n=1 Tax=Cellulomonas marina TaxID=988821 RepID=A0A1I0XYY2_9CELL|nr:TetR/AcrR family transcriptional regulator [Cellulomonas marina]GIG28483.1 hypothetical protein Cma02nite_10830 [Cellulomonas marina]SFB05550.1 DNA-binding transcriptional regulator, AcrR family [Cellulomonas marina]